MGILRAISWSVECDGQVYDDAREEPPVSRQVVLPRSDLPRLPEAACSSGSDTAVQERLENSELNIMPVHGLAQRVDSHKKAISDCDGNGR